MAREESFAPRTPLSGSYRAATIVLVGALYGREGECAELGRLVASAVEGAGGVVVVEGAAGIGKSRLLAHAAQIAAGQGVQVAAGGADELDQVTPWAPLLQALGSTSPALLSEADLAPVRALVDQRLGVIERIRAVLEGACRRGPLLITLDDLQWADAATVLALGSLPAQLFSYPVAWILAQRPQPSPVRLQGLAERLAEAGAARMHLAPLDPAAAAALAGDMLGTVPDAGVLKLIERAEGNPLYVVEMLRGMAGGTVPASAAAAPELPIPASLRSAVAAHLRPLPESAQDLLRVASVLGREFTVAEVAAVTGQPAGQLMPALRSALQAEVLAEDGDRLAFRHDLLRQAVYQDVPVSLRQALHRDAAGALRRTGAPLVRVAGQYAASARPGDEEAIEALTAAAGQLFTTSPQAAADFAVRALGLLPEGDARRAAMTSTAVGLAGWAGRLDEARALGEGYLADHPSQPEVTAGILLGIRQAWTVRHLRPYPVPVPARVLEDPVVPAGVRANLLALEQVGRMWSGDFAAADRAFATAMRLVAEGGEGNDAVVVLGLWVASDTMRGNVGDALDRAQRGLAQAVRDDSALAAAAFEDHIAGSLGGLGRPGDALAAVERAERAADSCGFTLISAHCPQRRAKFLFDQGRLDDARAQARAAAASAEALGFQEVASEARALLAEISLRQGDVTEAQTLAELLRRDSCSGSLYPDQHWARALYQDALGRPRAALEALEPAFTQIRCGCLIFAALRANRLPSVVDLAQRAGDDGRAAEAAGAASELAVRNPAVPLFTGAAAHARGLLGRDLDQLEYATDVLAGCQWPLAVAAAREDLGNALARHGSRERAVDELDRAYQAYVGAAAHRDAARARTALRALGVRRRRAAVARPGHGWASLTGAELAVVEIVAEGRTNREAAAQLYVSPDTVNTHLRHAFTKLGIRSRVELARLAADRERTPRQAHRLRILPCGTSLHQDPAFLTEQFLDLAVERGPGSRVRGVIEGLGAGLPGPYRDVEPFAVGQAYQPRTAKLRLGVPAGPQRRPPRRQYGRLTVDGDPEAGELHDAHRLLLAGCRIQPAGAPPRMHHPNT